MVLTETRKGLKDGFFGFSKAEIIFELIFSMKGGGEEDCVSGIFDLRRLRKERKH